MKCYACIPLNTFANEISSDLYLGAATSLSLEIARMALFSMFQSLRGFKRIRIALPILKIIHVIGSGNERK